MKPRPTRSVPSDPRPRSGIPRAGRALLAAALLHAGLGLAPCPVRAAGPDPGEALYRVGRQLLAEGKPDAALRKFDEALAASPKGPFADDALLAAATIDYPVTDLAALGTVEADRIDRAAPRLERIVTEYRTSDTAAEATFRLGLLKMDPSNRAASLDDAFAIFLQVPRLYPQSREASEAIHAAGTCHVLQGSRVSAAADDARAVLLYPRSEAGRLSRFRLAEEAAILGESVLARELLQPLAAETGAVDTLPVRARALDALIARANLERPEAPVARVLDAGFSAGAGAREITALEADPEGDLWLLDGGTHRVWKIAGESVPRPTAATPAGPAAKPGETAPTGRSVTPGPIAEDSHGFALDRGRTICPWDERGIALPGGKRFEPQAPSKPGSPPEPLKRIGGVSIGDLGEIDLLDAAGSRLLRYGPGLGLPRVLASFDSRPTAIARGSEGSIYVLLESKREIAVVPPGGEGAQTRIALKGAGWEIDSPIAIDVDALGRIYVLDDSARSITVLDRSGHRVATAASAKGSPAEMRSPTALAVDGEGRIYVADKRQGRILRFR